MQTQRPIVENVWILLIILTFAAIAITVWEQLTFENVVAVLYLIFLVWGLVFLPSPIGEVLVMHVSCLMLFLYVLTYVGVHDGTEHFSQ